MTSSSPSSARIALNLLHIVPGDVGGSEEYAVRTLLAYARHGSSDLTPVLYVLAAFAQSYPSLCETYETVVCPFGGVNRPRRVFSESTWLAARTSNADAVHHLGGRLPLRSSHPAAVTVHDVQPLLHPENISLLRRAFLARALPSTARRAEMVFATSEAVAEDLVSVLGADPSRVAVVPVGAERIANAPGEPCDPPTILYPAATYPHKNHVMLVKAFARIAERHPGARLVMTGAPGRADREVRAAVTAAGLGERIVLSGRIPSSELDSLLSSAVVLAFPSTFEGFGIPVLEAMAAGVPVVVAAGTPAAGMVGEGAPVLDPHDESAWAAALDRLLTNNDWRNRVARAGLAAATRNTWEDSAARLSDAWRRLLTIGES